MVMTEIVIDKKKYVLIPEKSYQALQDKHSVVEFAQKPKMKGTSKLKEEQFFS